MDEPNIYENVSNDGRRVIEESGKEMGEPMEQDDAERARRDRRRRRAERRTATCRCDDRPRARTRGRRRRILSQNPFIIFYLEMYFKTPDKHVTEVARQAGKEWCALPQEQRQKYILLAQRERKRRGRLGRPRRGC